MKMIKTFFPNPEIVIMCRVRPLAYLITALLKQSTELSFMPLSVNRGFYIIAEYEHTS